MKPTRKCAVDGCDQDHKARGWCRGHYERWQRHGDPKAGQERRYGDLEERLWSRMRETDSGCWEWLGGALPTGYGRIKVEGAEHYTHRLAYELMRGDIPPDLVLDHLCRNRACANPYHLEPVTNEVNLKRGLDARQDEGAAA